MNAQGVERTNESNAAESSTPAGAPGVCIILVNWNGWADTIECLESVFNCDYSTFQVVVCDNASTDGSPSNIRAWAEGRLEVVLAPQAKLRDRVYPPVTKPLPFRELRKEDAELGNVANKIDRRLVLIHTGDNLGFAGANNVGIRYALGCPQSEYVWLLNNDTVIAHDALSTLVERMQESREIGMCGSTLVYYDDPERVQALGGGRYHKWFGYPEHVLPPRGGGEEPDRANVESRMDYVAAASMLVSRRFLETVGLMSEEYFLYFEELDWAARAKGRFRIGYAPDSMVFHKEGASIGSSRKRNQKSFVATYYSIRNRLLFTRKHCPEALPTVYLGLLGSIASRLVHRRWDQARIIARLLVGRRHHKYTILRPTAPHGSK